MKLKTIGVCVMLFTSAGHLQAAQINFTSGTPALAADVNANFTELYNAKWTLTGADLSYSAGNVGLGVTTPASALHANGFGFFDSYSNTAGAPAQVALRRARGTQGAPSALQNGDEIGYFNTRGHDGTAFAYTTFIISRATENWSAGSHGSNMGFLVTPNGSTSYTERMTIGQNGYVGIGITSPSGKLSIQQGGSTNADGIRLINGSVTGYLYGDAGGTIHLNNSSSAALAINDTGGNVCIGCAATGNKLEVSGAIAGQKIDVQRSDNNWVSYSLNSNASGIGAYVAAASGANAALQVDNYNASATLFKVHGNSQVAFYSSGTTEQCRIGGTVNTCTSDSRLKRDILELPNVLSRIQNLRGVSFHWRENGRADIGLIAQDIEREFPQLVSINTAGYKMVSFNSLHGVTLQALKELKSEKDRQMLTLEQKAAQSEKRAASAEAEAKALRAELTALRQAQSDTQQRLARLEQKIDTRLAAKR